MTMATKGGNAGEVAVGVRGGIDASANRARDAEGNKKPQKRASSNITLYIIQGSYHEQYFNVPYYMY